MFRPRTVRIASVFGVLLLALSFWCVSPDSTVDCLPAYWPTEAWQYSTPEMQGVNPSRLVDMMGFIESNSLAIDSVVVVRNGYIILEEYPNPAYTAEDLHIIYSATKSVTSLLFGIAMQQGYITDTSLSVVDFFPDFTIANMDSRKESMTLWHLLTMSNGFDWDEWGAPLDDPVNNNMAAMIVSPDPVQYVLDRPMIAEPGEVWAYCGGATTLLGEIIERATGTPFDTYAREQLFEPLGIDVFLWGNFAGGYANTAGGLFLRPVDMARLGLLMLSEGIWESEALLTAGYFTEAIDDYYHVDNYDGIFEGVTYWYGYQFWSHPEQGVHYCWGMNDQKIYFVPEYDLVIAFTADPTAGAFMTDYLLWQYILPAMNEPFFNLGALLLPSLVVLAVAVPVGVLGVYWFRRRKAT